MTDFERQGGVQHMNRRRRYVAGISVLLILAVVLFAVVSTRVALISEAEEDARGSVVTVVLDITAVTFEYEISVTEAPMPAPAETAERPEEEPEPEKVEESHTSGIETEPEAPHLLKTKMVDDIGEGEVDELDVEMLACAIYQEAGGDACRDICRYMVGDIVLNRIADERFPDTMEMVLMDERQFGEFFWTGIKWPDRASAPGEAKAVQRAYDTARAILSGEHSEIYGKGYVWLAEFEQGSDVIALDGLYFGR